MKQENNPEFVSPPETTANNKQPDSKDQFTILKQYQDIVDRSHKEIEYVRNAYKWLISLTGICLTFIFVVGIYFTHKEISGMRADLKDLENEVKNRVDTELSKESIRTLINSKVSSRVDTIADGLIEEKITLKITPKIEESDNKLKIIDNQLKESLKVSKNIQEVSDFMLTFIRAQNDDSAAFEQLGRWGVDISFPFSDISLKMYETIRLSYVEKLGVAYWIYEWPKDVDPLKFYLTDFKIYLSSLEPKYHAYLVELIWKRDTISKKDKLIFFVDVLNTSNSLNAKNYAGRLLANEIGLKWHPFYIKPLLDKWEEIKDTL